MGVLYPQFRGLKARQFLGVAEVIAVALALGTILLIETGAGAAKGTDFFYFYSFARLIVDGHGGQIYDLSALKHVQSALAWPMRIPHGLIPNLYSPGFVVSLVPLAHLQLRTAYLLWLGFNCALLGIAMYSLEQFVALRPRDRWILRLGCFCSLPVVVALLQGQVSLILLAALTACFLAARARRDTLAGFALAATLIKPQFALPFLLVFLVLRRWRALAGFVAGAGLVTLGPLLVVGPSILPKYIHALLQAPSWNERFGGFQPHWNRSFSGFAQMLLPPLEASIVNVALSALAIVALLWIASRTKNFDLSFALAVVVALLASQHVLIHDLSVLVLPAVVAVRYRTQGPVHVAWLLTSCYVALVAGFPLALVTHLQLPTVAMAALGVWLFCAAGGGKLLLHGAPALMPAGPERD